MRPRYWLGRLGSTVVVVVGILIIAFVLTHVIPSDPARLALGPNATLAQLAHERRVLGLNRPLVVQFGVFVWQLLHGNLGVSLVTGRPVSTDIALFFPATLELVLCAMILLTVFGVIGGVFITVVRNRFLAFIARAFGMIGLAVPVFVSALLCQILFFGVLGWFPVGGRITGQAPPQVTGLYLVDSLLSGTWSEFWSAADHLVLPALVLAFSRVGVIMRFVSSELHNTLEADYVEVARAKGASELRVQFRHALRNAMVPVVSMVGLQFGWLLGGTVLVETVFSWPGLGQYMVNSISALDVTPVIATAVLLGLAFTVISLIADLVQEALDPRIGE